MPRKPQSTRAVKFTVSVGPRHARLLELLELQRGWRRSRAVQEALDRLMRDPSLFSPTDLHISAPEAHNKAEVA